VQRQRNVGCRLAVQVRISAREDEEDKIRNAGLKETW